MNKYLSELAEVHYGKSPDGYRTDFSDIPILATSGEIGRATRALFEGPLTVVARKGTLDNPTYFPGPCWVIDTAYAVKAKVGVDDKWLYYQLANYDLTSLNEATGVPSISRNYLYRIRLFTPSLPEQRKIARILSTVDEAIEHTEELIAKYQAIKQGLMHDLLTRGVDESGRLRPPREQAPDLYKWSEVGWVPRGWEVVTLGAIIREHGGFIQTGPFGSQLHAHEYVNTGVPVVMPQDIENGVIKEDKIAYITNQKARELARHIMAVNDVVFARRGDLSRCAAIGEREKGWLCGTGSMLLRISSEVINAQWLSYFYIHDTGQRQIFARAVGSTMVNLNSTLLNGLILARPSIEEQRQIVRRLNALDTKIRFESQQQQKFQIIKTGLMQDLLTGRVRVNVDEHDLAEVRK